MSLIVQCRHCRLLCVADKRSRRWHYTRTHGPRQLHKQEAFTKVKKLHFTFTERMLAALNV